MRIFVSGTGTGIGKTVVSAILTEALKADYWKPVQAGYEEGTDSEWVRSVITNNKTIIHPELYRLRLPASPHIAAARENIHIDIRSIVNQAPSAENLIIEGAGGIMVPLNETEFVADLVRELDARVVLVSRNTLGSINHSLLTAMACRQKGIRVLGWIFNGHYLDYEKEIADWSGYHYLGAIPYTSDPGKKFIEEQAVKMEKQFYNWPW